MPTISMFFGIIIRMYYDDHNPPHFHTEYGDFKASFDLDGNVLNGKLPRKQLKLVQAWTIIHQEDLEANWKLAINGEKLFKIDPLR